MFEVEVTVDRSAVDGIFNRLAAAVTPGSLAEFLSDQVDPYLRQRVSQRFAGEGDEVVGAWAPLRPATEKIRASKGYPESHPINVRSAAMMNFLTGTPGDTRLSGPGAVLQYPGNVGNPLTAQKIETAQRGKSYPQTVPRQVLGVGETDLLFIQSELVQYLFRGP